MQIFSSAPRSAASQFTRFFAAPGFSTALLAAVLLIATPALSQDLQVVAVGKGAANKACVNPGPDSQLDSTAAGDDVAVGPIGTNNIIHTGPNGICDTALIDDDVYAA